LNIGGKNFFIPEQAVVLLQRAFEAMKEPVDRDKQLAVEPRKNKGKEMLDSDPSEQSFKPAAALEGPESSKQAEVRGNSGKIPYCYQCKTKGHAVEVYHALMYCDICASHDHVHPRCPKFRATKLAAVSCRYAVEGLGFFHVSFESSPR
jgi:hypothetical protein